VNGDGYCGTCFPHLNMIMALAARTAVKAAAKVARMSMQRTTPMAVGRRIAAMTHSSIVFKTFISPTPVFEPTIRPYVHGIRGIVGMILQPRHECMDLQRACNGCMRCRCIPSSTPPSHCFSSPASADLREAMTLERRMIWTRSHPSVAALAVSQRGCHGRIFRFSPSFTAIAIHGSSLS